MNRARRPGEKFAAYRKDQAREERAIKQHLRGRYVHVSCKARMHTDPVTQIATPVVESPGGTYRRGN